MDLVVYVRNYRAELLPTESQMDILHLLRLAVLACSYTSSMFRFFLIGIDRLYSIVKPIHYRKHVTKRDLKLRVAVVWVASLVASIARVLSANNIIPLFILRTLTMVGAVIFLITAGLFPSTYILT